MESFANTVFHLNYQKPQCTTHVKLSNLLHKTLINHATIARENEGLKLGDFMKYILFSFILLNALSASASEIEHATTCPTNIVIEKTKVAEIQGQPEETAKLLFERNIEDGVGPTYLWLVIENEKTHLCRGFDIGDATSSRFVKTQEKNIVQVRFRNTIRRYDLSQLDAGSAIVDIIKR